MLFIKTIDDGWNTYSHVYFIDGLVYEVNRNGFNKLNVGCVDMYMWQVLNDEIYIDNMERSRHVELEANRLRELGMHVSDIPGGHVVSLGEYDSQPLPVGVIRPLDTGRENQIMHFSQVMHSPHLSMDGPMRMSIETIEHRFELIRYSPVHFVWAYRGRAL